MDFESPDVEKDFPGLYASESGKKSNESDFSDDTHEHKSKKDLLIGKRKDKKDSKKDRGYATLEGESSPEEDTADIRSPSKVKKSKPFKFPSKKEKREKSREKDEKKDKESDLKEIKEGKEKKKDRDSDKDKEKDKERKKEAKAKLKLKEHKKKYKNSEDSFDIGEELPIFGATLEQALERSRCHDGVEIPLVVRECITHVQDNGLTGEGIYKVSGNKSKIQHLRRLYNQRESVNLSECDTPTVTGLLKLFFRELPECVLTSKLLNKFEDASNIRDSSVRGAELKTLVQQLPHCNLELLSWMVKHLDYVASYEKQNKMSGQTLAQTLSQPMQMSQRLLAMLIHHSGYLFSDTKLTKYVPPLMPSNSNSLPETPDKISEELKKQESLLGQIHSEMNAGYVTKRREEMLWEVQRMITQLKRKLRTLEKEAPAADVQSNNGSCPSVVTQKLLQDGGDIETSINSVVEDHNITVNNTSVISNTIKLNPELEKNNDEVTTPISAGSGGIKHVVEAVIEVNSTTSFNKMSGTCNDDNITISTGNDRIICDNSEEIRNTTNNNNNNNYYEPVGTNLTKICKQNTSEYKGNVSQSCGQALTTMDELGLKLETEELLAVISNLQAQIDQEKSEINSLKLQIRSFGSSPSCCDFMVESCKIYSTSELSTSNIDSKNNKEMSSSVTTIDDENALLRKVKAETQVLQTRRKSLTDGIIDNLEEVIRLKAQLKFLMMVSAVNNNQQVSVQPASSSGATSGSGMTVAAH